MSYPVWRDNGDGTRSVLSGWHGTLAELRELPDERVALKVGGIPAICLTRQHARDLAPAFCAFAKHGSFVNPVTGIETLELSPDVQLSWSTDSPPNERLLSIANPADGGYALIDRSEARALIRALHRYVDTGDPSLPESETAPADDLRGLAAREAG